MKKIHYLTYWLGATGYTVPLFLIVLYWVNFYAPPEHEGLPQLISSYAFFGFLSTLTAIIVGARIVDLLADPYIAYLTDRSTNPRGRRLPFMEKAFLVAAIAVALVYLPPEAGPGILNIIWVAVFHTLVFVALSAYVTPFLAHMSALAHTESERINLATAQGLGESTGIILAAQSALIWSLLEDQGETPLMARQISFGILAFIAALFMLVPLITLRGTDTPITEPNIASGSFRAVLKDRSFLGFIAAYSIFFACVELIQNGGVYYVTVLLEKEESLYAFLVLLMVPSSILTAPLANFAARIWGKKAVMLATIGFLSVLLLYAGSLGRYEFSPVLQGIILFGLGGIPLGAMTVLVMAVITDLIEEARERDGQVSEAIYVAGRNFSFKMGLTIGAAFFASFLILGKDRGDDLGIRASCYFGAFLCLLAFLILATAYREKRTKSNSD
ncbi:MAG: MFS transporter [Leptospiraceae bacterium]